MNIAVIGGAGRSGRAFIAAALEKNHTIRASIRHGQVHHGSPKLIHFTGEADDTEHLKQVIDGTDAVVSLIGHVKGSKPTIQTEAMSSLILAMKQTNVTRVITLTGTGVRQAGDKISIMDRILNLGVRLVDPARIQDGVNSTTILQASSTDWTVVRVLKLEDWTRGEYQLSPHGPTAPVVSRKEVARLMLEALEKKLWIGKMPIVSPK